MPPIGLATVEEAIAVNTTLARLTLHGNSLGEGTRRAVGQAMALNTTLTDLNLLNNRLRSGAGRAIGQVSTVSIRFGQPRI